MRTRIFTVLLASLIAGAIAGPGAAAAGADGPIVAPKSQRAGKSPIKERIIGGYAPPQGMWPWMTAVQRSVASTPGQNDYQRQWCGGTLIHPRIVVTAAHCIDSSVPGNWRVLLGRQDLLGGGGEAIDVAQVRVHPQYSQANHTFRNDLALMILAQ